MLAENYAEMCRRMRPLRLALMGFVMAGSAWAQNAPIQSQQLPPLQQQTQEPGSPPIPRAPVPQNPIPQAPAPQAPVPQPAVPAVPTLSNPPASSAQAAPPTQPATPPPTTERPNIWVPAGTAKLEALDKVNAQATELIIKVGQSATFGSLTIAVKACVVRPPDQPADAAAYLSVTDSHPDSSGFDGWMLADEPSVSMMQNPIYDLRVTGCS